jgi:hypothetical protein
MVVSVYVISAYKSHVIAGHRQEKERYYKAKRANGNHKGWCTVVSKKIIRFLIKSGIGLDRDDVVICFKNVEDHKRDRKMAFPFEKLTSPSYWYCIDLQACRVRRSESTIGL